MGSVKSAKTMTDAHGVRRSAPPSTETTSEHRAPQNARASSLGASIPEGQSSRTLSELACDLRQFTSVQRYVPSSLTTSPDAGHPPGVELSAVNIDRSLGQRPFTAT